MVVPRRLDRPYTYRVPDVLQGTLAVGDAVLVPFGPVTLRGLVVELGQGAEPLPPLHKLREIIAISRDASRSAVDAVLLELSRWVSERYLAPWGQCLRLVLPPGEAKHTRGRYRVTMKGQHHLAVLRGLSPPERALLETVGRDPRGRSFAQIKKSAPGVTQGVVTRAVEQGWVIHDRPLPRSPLDDSERGATIHSPGFETEVPDGNDENLCWRVQLESSLRAGPAALLLEAPASECFAALLCASKLTLEANRGIIVIAPEVRRATAIAALARRRWGEAVEVWHSERSEAERAHVWRRIRSGHVRIVVGTRAAVFAPLEHVGLLCVDGEDQAALKEEQEPRYHAREVAWQRARLERASLLLLTRHASMESRVRIDQAGTWLRAPLPPAVPVRLVVLEHPPRQGALSPVLIEALGQALAAGRRAALYVNRRGYAPALVCTTCRQVPRCARCQVVLSFSQESRQVRCRACGMQTAAPDQCASCHATQFDVIGCGTERVQADVLRLFPRARVVRLDRDTSTARAGAKRDALQRQLAAGWDIAIGTKLMVNELPARCCGLVGVPYVEAGLQLPDFRAAERTYHEIQDVIGLLDPGSGGEVILQTCLPEHSMIQALRTGQRDHFVLDELALREALDYPPYASVIALQVVGEQSSDAEAIAGHWAKLLREAEGSVGANGKAALGCTVLGPVPGSPMRGRGRAIWRLIVKGRDGELLRHAVSSSLRNLAPLAKTKRIKLTVDVDPIELG